MQVIIKIDTFSYGEIRKHLLQNDLEQVCFLYYENIFDGVKIILDIKDYYLVVPNEYAYQSGFHVEIKESCQTKIIKTAWDKKLSLGEIHSHPTSLRAFFSQSDLLGFQEFVPHIWWRLKKGPYLAIVLTKMELDALVWIKNAKWDRAVNKIEVGSSVIRPSNTTIKQLKEEKWKKLSIGSTPSLVKRGKKK